MIIQKNDISIVKDTQSNSYLLKFKNPSLTGIGINTRIEVSFNIDLGQMVTDTGTRIPHAIDKFHYNFGTTLASEGEIIDWELVGDTNGTANIPTEILDPGYDLLHKDFGINTPVYDTTTHVTGSGYPGATIIIRDEAGNEIGRGVVTSGGTYDITLKETQKAGTKLLITQNTGVGESEPKTVIVEADPNKPNPPKVDTGDTIPVSTTRMTGNGTKSGNKITVYNTSTGESKNSSVLGNLKWSVALGTGFLNVGDILEITESTKDNSVVSDPTYVEVVADGSLKVVDK